MLKGKEGINESFMSVPPLPRERAVLSRGGHVICGARVRAMSAWGARIDDDGRSHLRRPGQDCDREPLPSLGKIRLRARAICPTVTPLFLFPRRIILGVHRLKSSKEKKSDAAHAGMRHLEGLIPLNSEAAWSSPTFARVARFGLPCM